MRTEDLNDGLKIRDAAKLLNVHENTVANMMQDHRLEWYYLKGTHGIRRVRASSVVKLLQKDMTPDWCGLCAHKLSVHTTAVETVVVDGKTGVRPIGWQCPRPMDQMKGLTDGPSGEVGSDISRS